MTTPLNTAIAALVLSSTVTGWQTGAFLCGLAACAGTAGSQNDESRQQNPEQGRQQAAQHPIITTDRRSKMPAST